MKPFILDEESIELNASEYIANNTNKQFVLLGVYGSLMNPNNGILATRLKKAFRLTGVTIEDPTDFMESYLLGFYKINNYKLVFSKKTAEDDGKATLIIADGHSTYIAMYAVPKSFLKIGDPLLVAEGCMRPFDFYHQMNQYTLVSNVMINSTTEVENETRPSPKFFNGHPSTYYTFLATPKFMDSSLKPTKEYLTNIINALTWAKAQGYDISDSYIEHLINIETID